MKDAKGHGSNSSGVQSSPIYAMHPGAQRNAVKAVDLATRTIAQIDNGIHSHQINSLPALQRRHYETIAETLANQGLTAIDPSAHSRRVSQFADRLASTNPKFNRQRFIEAASGKRK